MFQQFDLLLSEIAAIALGFDSARDDVETTLARLEAQGWQLREVVHRIWEGERDPIQLTSKLHEQDAQIIERILQLIDQLTEEFEPDTSEFQALLADLPPPVSTALDKQDEAAFWNALAALPPDEQDRVRQKLDLPAVPPNIESLIINLPINVRLAILDQDLPALQRALQALPPEQAQALLNNLMQSGLVDQAAEAEAQRTTFELEPMLLAFAAVGRGDTGARPLAEQFLDLLEAQGWQLRPSVMRIWEGERDLQVLIQDLDPREAHIVEHILQLLQQD